MTTGQSSAGHTTAEHGTPAHGTPEHAGGSRLHPLTPLLRGGRYLLLVSAVFGQQAVRQGDGRMLLLIALAGTPLAVLAGLVSWLYTRYRIEDGELRIDSGVLIRRNRRVPLARVQSIDLVRPLLARVLGLAELRLEVVGGGSSEGRLSYLTESQALILRSHLLTLATGIAPDPTLQPTDDDQPLLHVPTGTLIASVLLGAPAVVLTIALLATVVTAAISRSAVVVVLITLLTGSLSVLSVSVRRVLAEYGFRVSHSPQGLRLRHGLLDTRSQTIPAGRVQALRLSQPLLWRPFGWVRVEVDVAGYGGRQEEQAATSALLPVAPRAIAERLIAEVLGVVPPVPHARVPARARWRAPIQHSRMAYGADASHLVTTYGVFSRKTDVVPLAKAQSLRTTQGPWQRRLGLASLHLDVAGRQIRGTTARHRDAGEAAATLARLTDLARTARRAAVNGRAPVPH